MNESCHTYERFISHTWMGAREPLSEKGMSHVTHVSHIWMSRVTHVSHIWMSRVTHVSHIWMSHVTHVSHIWMSHVTHVSHIWMSRITHMNESCHTHERVMSHYECIGTREPLGKEGLGQSCCWSCQYHEWYVCVCVCVWHDAFNCNMAHSTATSLTHMCEGKLLLMAPLWWMVCVCVCMTWLIQLQHDSFICVCESCCWSRQHDEWCVRVWHMTCFTATWLILLQLDSFYCNLTHSAATWPIRMCEEKLLLICVNLLNG